MSKVQSVEIFQRDDERWYWRSKDAKGKEISSSEHGYQLKANALDMAYALFHDVAIFNQEAP